MARRNPLDSIQITSVHQCALEFDILKEALLLEETEDTWQNIDSSLKRFTAAVRAGACDYPDEFIKRWKETEIVRGLISAMSTERTRLSGTALDLMGATSQLGHHWDSAVAFYAPAIIKLLGRASKIYVTRATNTLTVLIKGTKSLAFIPYLADGISEKSLTIRTGCAEALLCCLTEAMIDTDPSDSSRPRPASRDVPTKRLNEIENMIKTGGRDRDPKVRAIIKRIWELYEQKWPTRATSLAQPFTPTIKRYLGISLSSTLASSVQTVSVTSGRHHASQPPSTTNFANQDIHQSQPKSLLKGRQPAGSKHKTEGNPPPPTRSSNHNSSKPVKSFNPQASFPKSGDLATLQKAMMIPLPLDEPEHAQPSVASGPTRARVQSARTRTPVEGSIHQAHQSGTTTKRSNSTMRAQRVPLSSHADLPLGGVNGSTRAPARVPFQSIQSTGHPAQDGPIKPHMNPFASSHPEPSSKSAVSSTYTNAPKATFKPTRVASSTSQADSKPPSQPHPTLQTRPLPRRVAQEAPSDNAVVAPAVNNMLNVSVRSNPHSRKAPAEQEVPIVKQTSKAFKPKKPSVKVSAGAEPSSSKPSSSKTVTDFNPIPAAPCHLSNEPLQAPKVPISLEELPEGLRLPASIPLPCSPSPPPATLPSSTLPSESAPSSALAPVSNPPPSTPTETFPSREPFSTRTLPSSSPSSQPEENLEADHASANGNLEADQDASANATLRATSLSLQPGNPTQVISQPLKLQSSSLSSSLPIFGTPGPKICRSLPDDLIVPMSVPLPPSPNSPFPQLNLRTRSTPRHDRRNARAQSTRSHLSPRSRTNASSSCLSAAVTTPTAIREKNSEHLHHSSSKPSAVAGPSRGDEEADRHIGQQPVVQEGLLVDFDHEDTIWVPPPPAIHDDLLQLHSDLGIVADVQEESEHEEDGPREKRPRLGIETKLVEKTALSSTHDDATQPTMLASSSPNAQVPSRPLRRDPTMFHWDLPDLDSTNPDDSDDRTISCLKEQPLFLAGDITINEGISFHTSFLDTVNPQNQSTPASAIVPHSLQRPAVQHLSP